MKKTSLVYLSLLFCLTFCCNFINASGQKIVTEQLVAVTDILNTRLDEVLTEAIKLKDNAIPSKRQPNLSVLGNPKDFSEFATIDGKVIDIRLTVIDFDTLSIAERLICAGINNPDFTVQLSYGTAAHQQKTIAVVFPFRFRNGKVEKLLAYQLMTTASSKVPFPSKPIAKSTSTLSSSVLATGNWYKIAAPNTGVYKIDAGTFQKMGLNVSSINPRNIRVYGNGGTMLPEARSAFRNKDLQELPIIVTGESDGIFDQATDYVLFYSTGTTAISAKVADQSLYHITNRYADSAYYFVTVANSPGKRVVQALSQTLTGSTEITDYNHIFTYELDKINLGASGRHWYGEVFDFNLSQNFNFQCDGLLGGTQLKVKTAYATAAYADGQFTNFKIALNGNQISQKNTATINPAYSYFPFSTEDSIITTTTAPNTNVLNLTLTFDKNGVPQAINYLDYIEINARRQLQFYNNNIIWRAFSSLNKPSVTYKVVNVNTDMQVWDCTNVLNPGLINYSRNGSTVTFSATSQDTLRSFCAFNPTNIPIATFMNIVANQDIANVEVPNLLIITVPQFLDQANRLANFRRQNDNLKVKVVTTAQIYNQYSSGGQDLTALRDYCADLYKASAAFKYLLLFGGASYDYKNRIPNNTNFIPIFESEESCDRINSFSSDDYCAFLDDNEGKWPLGNKELMDIGIGRFSVKTVDEATNVVDKIINYAGPNSLGKWRNTLTFVADDGNNATHSSQSENVINSITNTNVNFNKIYLAAEPQTASPSGEISPVAYEAVNQAVINGSLLVNYSGHGNENLWASERMLDIDLINSWSNYNRLPFFVTATCEFGRYDDPARVSGGQLILIKQQGAGIGLLTTCRPVNSYSNEIFNKAFAIAIFNGNQSRRYRVGDFMLQSKNKNADSGYGAGNRGFSLLADPSMKLAIPDNQVILTSINNVNFSSQVLPSMRGLDKVALAGIVADTNGNILTKFNGTLICTIYDKPTITSVTDVQSETGNPSSVTYNLTRQNNIIYNGQATVINGKFTVQFIVPKDINYSLGRGKISLYAYSTALNTDATGSELSIVVGGSNPNAPEDDTAPTARLFMNDTTFTSGGLVSPNAIFIAKLKDSSGINLSTSGIGHEITIKLNAAPEPIVVSQYYTSDKDTYTSGNVTYPFTNLALGNGSITLKVWDSYNNSYTDSIDFIVVNSSDFIVTETQNAPNPFSNFTNFTFKHSAAGKDLNVIVNITDVLGKKVATLQQTILNSTSKVGSDGSISWSGNTSDGSKVPDGLYIYTIEIKPIDGSGYQRKTGKLIFKN